MNSRYTVWFALLTVLATLVLAGCQGLATQASSTTAPTFQLTVTAPPSGAGTITSSPAGINCPTASCSASFAQNTQVTLTATPSTNYTFGGWSGACSGTGVCSITITAATSVTAAFTAGFGLTVALAGAGTGTVTSSPAGINCPATACSAGFPQNTQVTLTATPGANYYFGGWGGSCSGTTTCSVTVTAAITVTAAFSGADSLTVAMAGAGTGTVTSTPAGINCSASSTATCSASFPPNTQVALTETPGTGNAFSGWSGACTGDAACSVTLSASTSVTATFVVGGTLQSLNHIIIFSQENRSFDHYFGALRAYWAQKGFADQSFDGLPQFNPTTGLAPLYAPAPAIPGCDPAFPYVPPVPPATVGQNLTCIPDTSNLISSFPLASVCQEVMSPFWNEGHRDWDLNDPTGVRPALNNGFVVVAGDEARQYYLPENDTNGIRAMGYFDGNDLNYYYFMASKFATSDRWFSPLIDRTQIDRMYLLAATSDGQVYPLGAGAPPTHGALTNTTIFEELQNAGITWKIYVNPEGTSCGTNDPQSSCLITYSYINMFTYYQTILNNPTLLQNIVPISQFTTDAQNGTLPQVALIEPASAASLDEHPSDNDEFPVDIESGAAYAAGLINTFMTSPSWHDSAMIFTYDESGGFYDHVSPQPVPAPENPPLPPSGLVTGDICDASGDIPNGTCNFQWTGYRVPLIVISPFTRKNYVSHVVRDYTAMLNLIEERFNVPALTQRDAYWSTAQAGTNPPATMDEFFDFVNVPWATPPSPPAQHTGASCSIAAPPWPPPSAP